MRSVLKWLKHRTQSHGPDHQHPSGFWICECGDAYAACEPAEYRPRRRTA